VENPFIDQKLNALYLPISSQQSVTVYFKRLQCSVYVQDYKMKISKLVTYNSILCFVDMK